MYVTPAMACRVKYQLQCCKCIMHAHTIDTLLSCQHQCLTPNSTTLIPPHIAKLVAGHSCLPVQLMYTCITLIQSTPRLSSACSHAEKHFTVHALLPVCYLQGCLHCHADTASQASWQAAGCVQLHEPFSYAGYNQCGKHLAAALPLLGPSLAHGVSRQQGTVLCRAGQ